MEPIRLSENAGLLIMAWVVILLGGEEFIRWWKNKEEEK
jgi:hypothetical protein